MDDLISRQAATQTVLEFIVEYLGGAFDEDFQKKLMERMNAVPPAQKGKWIMLNKGLIVTSYKCSECGRTVRDDTGYDVSKDYPFCHCGANMRGESGG